MTDARPETLGAAVARQAANSPDRIALICGERRRTYSELDERSNMIAQALRSRGVDGGARVAILARNSDVYVELLAGVGKLGACSVVLNWRLSALEIARVGILSEPSILFWDEEFEAAAKALAREVSGVQTVAIGNPTDISRDYESLVASGSAKPPNVPVPPDSPLLLMFTSGTTGTPKGVPATHHALLQRAAVLAATEPDGNEASSIHLMSTPLFHVAALGLTVRALLTGGAIVISPDAHMAGLVDAIERHRVTHAGFVPSMMPALLDAVADGRDLSSIRMIAYGASPIPEALLMRLIKELGCGFRQNYGMSEVSGGVTYLGPADHYVGSPHLLSCGRVYEDTRIRIVDDAGTECPVGETGEILIQSPSLLSGYWRQPAASKDVIRNGWYSSGDLGFLDREGYLYLRDRKKDMIISGGENIYPAEVEGAIATHAAVASSAVIGVPSERWGEEAKAIVVLRDGADLDEAALKAHLRGRLGGYKIPKTIEFVNELPTSSLGKVLKHELRERYWPDDARKIN